jgi:hypothetical protein
MIWPHQLSAQSLVGKTIQASIDLTRCNATGCATRAATIHVYVGTQGRVFDYWEGAGQNGAEYTVGVAQPNRQGNMQTITVSGNIVRLRTQFREGGESMVTIAA